MIKLIEGIQQRCNNLCYNKYIGDVMSKIRVMDEILANKIAKSASK